MSSVGESCTMTGAAGEGFEAGTGREGGGGGSGGEWEGGNKSTPVFTDLIEDVGQRES